MADDIPVTPSEHVDKTSVATDDVLGRHFQIVKLAVGDTDVAELVESSSGSISVIDHSQKHIHAGEGFTHSEIHTGLGTGNSSDQMIRVGARPIHVRALKLDFTDAPMTIEYFEGVTVSADGTPKGIGNNDRTSSKVTSAALFINPTVTDTGTPIGANLVPLVTSKGGNSVDIIAGGEWILKANTDYIYRVTNNSNSSVDFSETLFFYEPGAV